MSVNVNSGATTASINGTITGFMDNIIKNGTYIIRNDETLGGSTNTTIYTVTAGKTLYITEAYITSTGEGYCYLYSDNDNKKIICTTSPGSLSCSFPMPVVIPSTKAVIKGNATAFSRVSGGFVGYEI